MQTSAWFHWKQWGYDNMVTGKYQFFREEKLATRYSKLSVLLKTPWLTFSPKEYIFVTRSFLPSHGPLPMLPDFVFLQDGSPDAETPVPRGVCVHLTPPRVQDCSYVVSNTVFLALGESLKDRHQLISLCCANQAEAAPLCRLFCSAWIQRAQETLFLLR